MLASWTEPVAYQDALAFFRRGATSGPRTYWERPEDGRAIVGLGAAHAFEPSGPGRFAALGAAWRALLADAVVALPDGAPSGAGPALLGGLAFEPTRQRSEELPGPSVWWALPTARLVLPRLQLTTAAGRAWLTTNVAVEPDAEERHLADTCRLPSPAPAPEPDSIPNRLLLEDALPAEEWASLVGEAAARIRGGAFEKVVLAREVRVRGERPFAPEAALRRLRAAYPTCTVFALADARFCFLGATPERLGRVVRGRVDLSCLAGTAPRGADQAEDERIGRELLTSRKNRHEHAVVARMLAARLAPLCDDLRVPGAPELMKVRNVQHLYSPITGALRQGLGPLDLAGALHPTPAVGGFPDEEALPYIRAHERLDRGWYAGPFGWVDARGDGDFAVALRSGLLDEPADGGFGQAHLYAGCGVVADSDPAAEYEESCLKLRPMLGALGGDR